MLLHACRPATGDGITAAERNAADDSSTEPPQAAANINRTELAEAVWSQGAAQVRR